MYYLSYIASAELSKVPVAQYFVSTDVPGEADLTRHESALLPFSMIVGVGFGCAD